MEQKAHKKFISNLAHLVLDGEYPTGPNGEEFIMENDDSALVLSALIREARRLIKPNPMRPLTQLWIRACKSREPRVRLRSVYRRFYCGEVGDSGYHISQILAGIVDDLGLSYKTSQLFDELSEGNSWRNGDTYTERCLASVISKIAFTEISKLPDLTSPRRFRK